jgi:hypothetical protein
LFGEIALVDDAEFTSRVARFARMRVKAQAIDLEYGRCVRQRRRAPSPSYPANEPASIRILGRAGPQAASALQANATRDYWQRKSRIREMLKMQTYQEYWRYCPSYREILFRHHE